VHQSTPTAAISPGTKTVRHSTNLLSLVILSTAFSTAHALEAPPAADIRCLIVGSRLSTSADANQRAAGHLLAIYSMARLDQFSPKEIEDAMFNEALAITPTDFQSDAARCGKILMEKGQEMTQIGNNLVRRGNEMKDKQTAAPAVTPSAAPPADEKKTNNK
jgi:hypothetical protein